MNNFRSNWNTRFVVCFLSPIGTNLLGGFLSSMNGSSITFVGGVMRDDFKALEGGSLSTNKCLLPHSFIGDGITGNAFKSDCFLATGNDGMSGVFSGSNELIAVKVVC
jgi:hypothetical protein